MPFTKEIKFKNTMKKLPFLPLLVMLLSLSTQIAIAQKSDRFAFKQNARMGRGVNILSADPVWKTKEKTRFNDEHFKIIKKGGFDNVRIAIHPFKYIKSSTDFTLDPSFFQTLDWSVKESLSNNLMTIIDLHEHGSMSKNPLDKKPMLLAIWEQIAAHYKDYPKELLFEICNEPNMDPTIWNGIQSEGLKIVRKSNPNRTILIGTINGNQIKHLEDLKLDEKDRNIIVAVHYYSPIQFTHQGAPWSTKNKDLSGIEWTNDAMAEKAIRDDFDFAQKWAKKHNRPITLGEFGAYEKADMPSRIRWTNFVAREAEARSWSWSYWQFDSDFIVFNIEKQEWVTPIYDALIPKK